MRYNLKPMEVHKRQVKNTSQLENKHTNTPELINEAYLLPMASSAGFQTMRITGMALGTKAEHFAASQ